MWKILCRERDLQRKKRENISRRTMDAEVNNVIYMELYSEAKMVDDKYLKTNNVRSIDRDSTVYSTRMESVKMNSAATSA
jgi:hypothetical protein